MSELGYLPDPAEFDPEELLDQVYGGASWLFEPGSAASIPTTPTS